MTGRRISFGEITTRHFEQFRAAEGPRPSVRSASPPDSRRSASMPAGGLSEARREALRMDHMRHITALHDRRVETDEGTLIAAGTDIISRVATIEGDYFNFKWGEMPRHASRRPEGGPASPFAVPPIPEHPHDEGLFDAIENFFKARSRAYAQAESTRQALSTQGTQPISEIEPASEQEPEEDPAAAADVADRPGSRSLCGCFGRP
jgi:hypothetical protein